MDKTKEVVKYYNDGQDEIKVLDFINNQFYIEYDNDPIPCMKKEKINKWIGSYEWLCNKKYGVLKTFKFKTYAQFFTNKVGYIEFKTVEEILKLLHKQIKPKD